MGTLPRYDYSYILGQNEELGRKLLNASISKYEAIKKNCKTIMQALMPFKLCAMTISLHLPEMAGKKYNLNVTSHFFP